MISHTYSCIFVHQRKSAGTSVKALFPDVAGADRGRYNEGVLSPDWDSADPEIRSYYKFTVIRNPWDRFVSGWKYCKSTKGQDIHDVLENLPRPSLVSNVFARRASLASRFNYGREALKRARDRGKFNLRRMAGIADREPQLPGHDYRHITRQQRDTVFYSDGSLAVDKVVFFEDLAAGMAEVCAAVGLEAGPLPAQRVRRAGDDYRRHFDARARALFDAAFRPDIEAWGYDFDSGLPDFTRF